MNVRSRKPLMAIIATFLFGLLIVSMTNWVAADSNATAFTVRIENTSGDTALPAPFAPGAYAVHTTADPFFTAGTPDRGQGLEGLAEDGGGADLATAVSGQPGILSAGAFGAAPIGPGEAYEFTVVADDPDAALSFATMFVQSNDGFISPYGAGIPLFDNGMPISGDVSSYLALWDAGTEVNEAPGSGPNQPINGGPLTGAREGVVSAFSNSTRSLPLASGIAAIAVEKSGSDYTITITNVSGTSGAVDTPIAPVFYATHNANWQLFTPGTPDVGHGLEMLAEDGGPDGLVSFYGGNANTDTVAAAGAGGVGTGGAHQFTVTANPNFPYVSLAAMAVTSNDAFLAFGPDGISLYDDGMLRSAESVAADMLRQLALWDAGTEANEVPGVGPNQPMNGGPAVGPADANPNVRLYSDPTNDLDGPTAGFFDLDITHTGGTTFQIELYNTSNTPGYAYPCVLAPLFYATHNASVKLLQAGTPAAGPLERLAEDGNPAPLVAAAGGASGIFEAAATDGPALGGESHSVTVTLDPAYPYLSLAAMIVPSNDAFVAFDGSGIALLDAMGNARPQQEIDADIAAYFQAWDAGTERNQAGGAGPDQAGAGQTMPNQGASEGNGTVRVLTSPDPVWSYPANVAKVTITTQSVVKVIDYQFEFLNGNSTLGTGTYYLLADGTFLTENNASGTWENYAVGAWVLEYASGDVCDGLVVAQSGGNGTLYGTLYCQDGSGNIAIGTGMVR